MEYVIDRSNDLKIEKLNQEWQRLAAKTIFVNQLWKKHHCKKRTIRKIIDFVKDTF
jgi:hypothetical protein